MLLPVVADTDALLPALAAALAGDGPPVLPLPRDEAEAAALLSALRPDRPEDPRAAVVVGTSGSTGTPKGVVLSAQALLASAAATQERLGGPGQWLLAMSPRYIGGLQVLVRSLHAGTEPLVLDLAGGFRPEAFAEATGRLTGARTFTALVPTQLRRLLDAGGEPLASLASYDAVLLGGAAAPASLLEQARGAGVRVLTTYGMSETSGGCVYDGVPLHGVTWDLDQGGRIRLAGPVLALGYRFGAAFDGGPFTTADLGAPGPGGRLVVLGRVDDVIITGGQKVAALAVEDALTAHPAVSEAAVLGVPDREWGQRVQAWVVLAAPAEAEELRAHVAARLPRAAVPRVVLTVQDLPRLPGGKVDRRALVR